MMLSEYIPFVALLFISCAVGILLPKKASGAEGFFLGQRSLNWFMLMMTFIGTQIGGGFILGTAEAAFKDGFYGIFYSLGLSCGFLVLGLGLGARIRSLELNTVADVFERYYKSPFLKKYASILSIISLTGILIAQAVSLKKFLFSTSLASEALFIISWMVVIAYTTKGGFLAVVWTDMVQAVAMIVMLAVVFVFALFTAPSDLQITTTGFVKPEALSYLVMPFLFMFIEQDMVQRCSSGKSLRQVTVAAFAASVVLFLLAFVPVYFGLSARALKLEPGQGSVFMEVVKAMTNPWVTSCAALSVLLAIISTASSLLLAVSSNIAQDFNQKISSSIAKSRAITISVGILALAVSYTARDIIPCLIMSYELAVDCLFVPLIAAVILKERVQDKKLAALLSVALGSAGYCLEQWTFILPAGYFTPIILSTAGYALGYFFTKKSSSAHFLGQ